MTGSSRLILAIALAVAGCATLSEEECQVGNWEGIGYTDGAEGQAPARFGDHNKACSEYGIAADFAAWQAGYEQGLEVYCTADNGAWAGAKGKSNTQVCVGPRGEAFQDGYAAGREYYEAEQALEHANSDYDELENELDDLQLQMDRAEAIAKDSNVSQDERNAALTRLRSLERQYGRDERELRDIHRAVRDLEQDANYLRQRLRDQFPAMRQF
jgi:hypothetical protein